MEKFSKEDIERWTGVKLLDWQCEWLNDVLMREWQKFENEILYGKSDDKEPVGLISNEKNKKSKRLMSGVNVTDIYYDEFIRANDLLSKGVIERIMKDAK